MAFAGAARRAANQSSRDVRHAESIIAAMDPARYDVQRIFITPEGRWEPRAISPEPGGNPGIDVVFPVLHGTFGACAAANRRRKRACLLMWLDSDRALPPDRRERLHLSIVGWPMAVLTI